MLRKLPSLPEVLAGCAETINKGGVSAEELS